MDKIINKIAEELNVKNTQVENAVKLIDEDEFKIVDVIASRLRNEQYIVDVYGDGEEGLDNALTNIYDLIILDVMLPGIEGFKILQEIRKQKIESKVIMLTAKSMLEDKLTGFDAGSNVQIKVVRGLGYKLEC